MPRAGNRASNTKTIREEGVVKTKRNYILYQSGIRKIKEEPKPEPPKQKAKPAPAKKPEQKTEYVKKTEVIDNYNYLQSENNTKIDPRRKSITIH